jgi:DNA-binding LacI/PurR family transcriptional regulator
MQHIMRDSGRKHLAILLGMDNNTDFKVKGYERALAETGSSLNNHLVLKTSGTVTNPYEAGVLLAKEAIKSGRRIDGMVLHSDSFAPGVMRVLYQNGLRVPKDVAIVGFDGDEFCSALPVSLTTVKQPRNVGEKALELLLQQLEEEKVNKSIESIVLSPELVIRESTTKPIVL